MKLTILLFLATIAIFAFSCDENRVFEEHKGEFPKFRWEKSNDIVFSPKIENIEQDYRIQIALRHIYGLQLKTLKVKMVITSPSGVATSDTYELQVLKDINEYFSECAGDICDLVVLIEDDYRFKETGTYNITVSQATEYDQIPNIMDLGLIIDKKILDSEN